MGHGGRRGAWVGVLVGSVALTLAGCATPEPQPDRVAGATASGVTGPSDSGSDEDDDDRDGRARGTRSLTPWTPPPRPTWSAPASALWDSGTHLVTSPKGTFTAVVPRSWRPAPCPVAGADCLHVVPAGAPDPAGLLVGGSGNGVEGSPVDYFCWLPGAGLLMGGDGVRKVQVGGYPGFHLSLETNDRGRTGAPPVDDVLALACVPVPGAPTPKGPGSVLPVLVQCNAVGSAALLATCERVAATVGMPGLRVARPGR